MRAIIRNLLFGIGFTLPLGLGGRGKGAKIAFPRSIRGGHRLFVGERSFIHRGSQIQLIDRVGSSTYAPRIEIGSDVYIGQHVFLASINGIEIADQCVLSDHVYISDSAHGLNPLAGPIMAQPLESRGPIRIGRGCFVGYRAIIMPGVQLGAHCVVAAGSVVTKSFSESVMVAGVPAKVIRRFCFDKKTWVSV